MATHAYINGHMWVPVDDYNTIVYNWVILPPGEREARAKKGETRGFGAQIIEETPDMPIWFRDARMPIGAGNEFGVDVDINNGMRSIANRTNLYGIDRQVQKTQTYTGIPGVNTQDRAVQESMGAIADRTLERLGTTDTQIIHARRSFLQAVKAVEAGGDPPGLEPSYYDVRPTTGIVPKGVHWYEALQEGFHRPQSEEALLTEAKP